MESEASLISNSSFNVYNVTYLTYGT